VASPCVLAMVCEMWRARKGKTGARLATVLHALRLGAAAGCSKLLLCISHTGARLGSAAAATYDIGSGSGAACRPFMTHLNPKPVQAAPLPAVPSRPHSLAQA
jgi:hypothetical protein